MLDATEQIFQASRKDRNQRKFYDAFSEDKKMMICNPIINSHAAMKPILNLTQYPCLTDICYANQNPFARIK